MRAVPAITGLTFLTNSMLGGVSFPYPAGSKERMYRVWLPPASKTKVLRPTRDKMLEAEQASGCYPKQSQQRRNGQQEEEKRESVVNSRTSEQ